MIIFRFETSQHEKWATTCDSFNTRYFCLQVLTWIQITCKSLFIQQPGFEIIHVLIRFARITYFHSRSLLLIAAGLLSGAFAWWGKTSITFVISVHLSASFSAANVRRFPWNLVWGMSVKICREIPDLVKIRKKCHFTWRPKYVLLLSAACICHKRIVV